MDVAARAVLRDCYRIIYHDSKSGCQVAQTSLLIFKALNAHAKKQRRHFHLVMESTIPHVKAAMILDRLGDQRTFFLYDHLRLYFLPPQVNVTKHHPLCLGVIPCFRVCLEIEIDLDMVINRYR